MLTPRPDLPPLPLPAPAPAKSKLRGVLVFVAFLVAGGVVGYGIGTGMDIAFLDAMPAWALILTLVAAPFVAIAVHEAGHLAGGALVGFRFALFIVGPLRVERKRERLTLSLNKGLGVAGGLALSVPRDGHDLRRRVAALVAGGPLASFALALGAGAAGWATEGIGSGVLFITAAVSALIALATMIPSRSGGFASDGARLLTLARGGPAAEREAAVFALLAQSLTGSRPRGWDADLLARAADLRDGQPMEEAAQTFQGLYALDTDDATLAHGALSRRAEIHSALPKAARASLALDAAFFEAAVRRDVTRAQAWLTRLGEREPFADPTAWAVARWAIAETSGDEQRAAAELGEAQAHADLSDGTDRARLEWAGLEPLAPEATR